MYIAPTRPRNWSSDLQYLLTPLGTQAPQPDDTIYIYLTRPVSAVVGRAKAGVVFIVPRDKLPMLLAKLGLTSSIDTKMRYVALIELREYIQCRRSVSYKKLGIRPPATLRKISKKTIETLEEICSSND
ncbi:MAG: hypothetical protein QXZ55_03790 [Pyrobaculum sp.]